MNVSEVSQKNRRLQFWIELLTEGALSDSQKSDLANSLQQYRANLNRIISESEGLNAIVSDEDNLKLLDIERKIETLAEVAKLEAGRSTLLSR